MLKTLMLVTALLVGSSPGREAVQAALPACPPEQPDTRDMIRRFLTSPNHEPSRQVTGLVGVSPADVRLLSDPADAAACNGLHPGGPVGESGAWRWTFYAAGGKYFIALHYVDPPGATLQRVGFAPLFVYDASFNRIGGYAM
jgi:hypothetical protein